MQRQLREWPADKKRISLIRFGRGTDYLMYSEASYNFDSGDRAQRIEYGLQAGASNLFQRMQDENVPGLSLAVIRNNTIEYARAYGTLEAERFASATSPFDTASLSKYIAALGFMRVAQLRSISLDTDARAIANAGGAGNQLATWKFEVETRPKKYGMELPRPLPGGLTMRRLLSHTSSLEPWGSPGFDVQSWPSPPPSTSSLLLGYICNSSSCGFGGDKLVWHNPDLGQPGSGYRYSGGGYLVMQAALERVTGASFPVVIHQRVFAPMAFQPSEYVLKPPSADIDLRIAKHHDSSGKVRRRAIYPWAAAGGLYATPREYALAMIPLLNGGLLGDGQRFLP